MDNSPTAAAREGLTRLPTVSTLDGVDVIDEACTSPTMQTPLGYRPGSSMRPIHSKMADQQSTLQALSQGQHMIRQEVHGVFLLVNQMHDDLRTLMEDARQHTRVTSSLIQQQGDSTGPHRYSSELQSPHIVPMNTETPDSRGRVGDLTTTSSMRLPSHKSGEENSRFFPCAKHGVGREMLQLVVHERLVTNMDDLQALIGEDGKLRDGCIRLHTTEDSDEDRGDSGFKARRFMMPPTSSTRLQVDVMSLLVLLFDISVTPFLIAWKMKPTGALYAGQVFTTFFWTMDLIISFRTGYYSGSRLVMNPCKTALHYLRTYFLVDFAVLAVDYVGFALDFLLREDSRIVGGEFLRFAKAGRMLRLIGVLRVSHIGEVLTRLTLRFPGMGIVLSVAQLLTVIIYINHLVACCWFLIGNRAYSDTGGRWIDLPDRSGHWHTTRSADTLYQYVTAFHFSLAQMTPGSMQIHPVNSIERIFNISCLLLGLLMFGTLISSLSAMMMDVKKKHETSEREVAILRRFLRISGVSRNLAIRLEYVTQQKLWVPKPLTIRDVAALQRLPFTDRADLDLDLSRRFLLRLPILRVCSRSDRTLIRKLAHEAMDMKYVEEGNLVFDAGKEAVGSYIITKGEGVYKLDSHENGSWALWLHQPAAPDEQSVIVEENVWLAEAALWCSWRHHGELKPNTTAGTMVMMLKAVDFVRVASERKLVRDLTHAYASTFVKLVTAAIPRKSTANLMCEVPPISDLPSSHAGYANYDEILLSWDPSHLVENSLRVYLSLVALHMAKEKGSTRLSMSRGSRVFGAAESVHRAAALETEVRTGKCSLVVDASGEVYRAVSIACVKLRREDSTQIMVNLGRVKNGKVQPDVRLPTVKLKEGVAASSAVALLFTSGQLRMFAGSVAWETSQIEIQHVRDKRYGIHSKFIRHIQRARVVNSIVLDEMPMSVSMPSANLTLSKRRSIKSETYAKHLSSAFPVEPFLTHSSMEGDRGFYVSAWVTEKEFLELKQAHRESGVLEKFLEGLPIDDALHTAKGFRLEETELPDAFMAAFV